MPVFGCGLSMRASLVSPFGHGDQRIERVGGHQVGQLSLPSNPLFPQAIPRPPGLPDSPARVAAIALRVPWVDRLDRWVPGERTAN